MRFSLLYLYIWIAIASTRAYHNSRLTVWK